MQLPLHRTGASPGTTDSQHRRPRPRPSHATLLKCLLGVALAMLVTYEVWQLGGSGAQLEGGLPTPRGPLPGHRAAAARGGRVEFGAPGLFVPLQDALDLDFPSQPAEVALLGELPPGGKLPPGKRDEAQMTLGDVMKLYVDTAGDSDRRRLAGDDVSGEDEVRMQRWEGGAFIISGDVAQGHQGVRSRRGRTHPQLSTDLYSLTNPSPRSFPCVQPEGVGDSVRILVGVTSACCSPRARARRDSVRRTWIKRTRALHPNVDIVFFLSQPENASVAAKALGPIAVGGVGGRLALPGLLAGDGKGGEGGWCRVLPEVIQDSVSLEGWRGPFPRPCRLRSLSSWESCCVRRPSCRAQGPFRSTHAVFPPSPPTATGGAGGAWRHRHRAGPRHLHGPAQQDLPYAALRPCPSHRSEHLVLEGGGGTGHGQGASHTWVPVPLRQGEQPA